ncbi:hypothetical protein GE09DRAFT_689349 [Coniochaeta sp. 2T2.1]|nr:hypothetical protein GE09DRAFT_689349 [Coniochaeta sp. 2T2.1]
MLAGDKSDGQIKKAVALLEQVVAVQERTLAEEHRSRLASQHALAGAYKSDGQIKKAVALLEQVVTMKRGCSRRNTLRDWRRSTSSQGHTYLTDRPRRRLDGAYRLYIVSKNAGGRKVVALLKQVVAVEARTLAEDYLDRLASLSALEDV